MQKIQLYKNILLFVVTIPFLNILYKILIGAFFDPIDEILGITGTTAIRLLLLSLAITPIVYITSFKKLYVFRRIIGVSAFVYVVLHFLTWALGQGFDTQTMLESVREHRYIIVGFLAGILMIPLAITSQDKWVKKMGIVKWKRLHIAVYPIAILSVLHNFLQAKSYVVLEPYKYMAIVLLVFSIRIYAKIRKVKNNR